MATQIFIEENSIYAMLLTEPYFKTFITKAVCDATKSTVYEHAFEDPGGHIWELVQMRGQP